MTGDSLGADLIAEMKTLWKLILSEQRMLALEQQILRTGKMDNHVAAIKGQSEMLEEMGNESCAPGEIGDELKHIM